MTKMSLQRGKNWLIARCWVKARNLSAPARRRWAKLAGWLLGNWPCPMMNQWARNVEIVTGRRPSYSQRRQATASWARNLLESITLERWSTAEIQRNVVCNEAELAELRRAHENGGAVVALSHLGSWDLVGAWARGRNLPVASVAERLNDARYEAFLDARRALGMRIYTLGEPGLVKNLVQDCGSYVVCLLADRDLRGTGWKVNWPTAGGSRPVTVPAGPALVAKLSGAKLFAVSTWYEGQQLRVKIHPPIAEAKDTKLMMQQAVDLLSSDIAEHVIDWHVLGKFFR